MRNKLLILTILVSIVASCKKDDSTEVPPVVLSDKNSITSFQLDIGGETATAIIDQEKRTIIFNTVDADLNALVPIINYSEKASINPTESVAQNFTQEVTYTVYAENGEPNVYRVIVNNISSESSILAFQLLINGKTYDGSIDNEAATIYIETDQMVDNADAVITVSEGAEIEPIINNPQNFYQPVEYILTAENGSTKTFTVTTKAYSFFSNGSKMFYSNAIAWASGTGIDISATNSSVVLENEQNSYVLIPTNPNSSTYTNGMPFNSFSFSFPEDIVSATDYKLKYLINGEVKTETNYEVDVIAENVPNPISLNQELYVWKDTLILTGENLPDTISIPSNGSIFIIKNSNNYDLAVNNTRTELTLTLDYHYLFPSYFARPQEEKTITLYGPNLRVGATIQTTFK